MTGPLMKSFENRDVSLVPGSWVARYWYMKESCAASLPNKHSLPEVLVADVGDDVVPRWLVDIDRWSGRFEADVAKRAGHADSVRRFDAGRIVEILGQ